MTRTIAFDDLPAVFDDFIKGRACQGACRRRHWRRLSWPRLPIARLMDDPDQRPRILIVDESRMDRATLIKSIRDQYSFREEADGEAGWQHWFSTTRSGPGDLRLSMPMLDGYGLLTRVRSSKLTRLRQIPVMMIAGDETEQASEHAKPWALPTSLRKGVGSTEILRRITSLRQPVAGQARSGR